MTAALASYDAACRALDAALAVDEVLEIRDQAEGLRAYARIAKDRSFEAKAAELRIRSERRVGLMLAAQRAGVGLARSAHAVVPTLEAAGIDKALADTARRYAEVPADDFEAMLAQRNRRIASGAGRITVSLFETRAKAERRARREAELAGKIRALPDKRYGVILADPEWDFEPWSRETGMDRAAANHYPTSPLAAIKARDVGGIAAADCALFLWATVPMLPQALEVMGAWGFAYVSHFVWMKNRLGTGYWNRNAHELLLLGTRGQVPGPAPGTQFASIVTGPFIAHSAKPETFFELIETYFPTLPKIELNRRGEARPGWDAWGNEAEPAPEEQAA